MRNGTRDSRPMRAPILPRADRVLFIALFLQLVAAGCDLTSPDKKNRGLDSPIDPSLTVSPSSITANAISWSEIDLSWATSPSASGYQIFRSTTGSAGTYTQIASYNGTVSTYPNTGLTGSTQYCYEIRSFKFTGRTTTYGAFSSPACATTLPPPVIAPSETDASPYAGPIRIRWKDNSPDEDGFRIEQASTTAGPWNQVSSVGANVTVTYVYLYYLYGEQPVCFRVTAFNSIGPSLPSTPDCTASPATPTNLSATPLDLQSVTLSWTDNSAVEDGYSISRSQDGGAWVDIATVGVNAASYRDATVTTDVSYRYNVRAVKDGGFSLSSNEATTLIATTIPTAPTGASVSFYYDPDYGTVYFGLGWGDASSNVAGFRVEISPDGKTGWTLYTETGPNVFSLYEEFPYGANPPSGCFQVIAFNNVGASTASNVTCGEPFGAPTDLVATAVDQQSIDLTWTDNANVESGYEIRRSLNGVESVVADVGPNTTSYHDNDHGNGLASGQEYWYLVVTMYDNAASNSYSNYAAATTLSTGASPVRILPSSPSSPIVHPAPKGPIRIKGVPTRAPRRGQTKIR